MVCDVPFLHRGISFLTRQVSGCANGPDKRKNYLTHLFFLNTYIEPVDPLSIFVSAIRMNPWLSKTGRYDKRFLYFWYA